jgi:hypothetical protein
MPLHLRTYRGQASQHARQESERAHSPTHDVVQTPKPRAPSPGTSVNAFTDSVNGSEWRGEDLNLRPSGYETYSIRPTGLYGLIEFVRFADLPGEMRRHPPHQENVLQHQNLNPWDLRGIPRTFGKSSGHYRWPRATSSASGRDSPNGRSAGSCQTNSASSASAIGMEPELR